MWKFPEGQREKNDALMAPSPMAQSPKSDAVLGSFMWRSTPSYLSVCVVRVRVHYYVVTEVCRPGLPLPDKRIRSLEE